MKTILFVLTFSLAFPVFAADSVDSIRGKCGSEAMIYTLAINYRNGKVTGWADYKGNLHKDAHDGHTLQHAIRDIGSISFVRSAPKRIRIALIKKAYTSPLPSNYITNPDGIVRPINAAHKRIFDECLKRHHSPLPSPEELTRVHCNSVGQAYSNAIEVRDKGQFPKVAYKKIAYDESIEVLSDIEIKNIINQVYFNPQFARGDTMTINLNMTQTCMMEHMRPLR